MRTSEALETRMFDISSFSLQSPLHYVDQSDTNALNKLYTKVKKALYRHKNIIRTIVDLTHKWIFFNTINIIPKTKLRSSYVGLRARPLVKLTIRLSGAPIRINRGAIISKREYRIWFVQQPNPYTANKSFK